MKAINEETLAAVKDALAGAGKDAVNVLGDSGTDAAKGVMDLFKKKK
jgi:hypothetical protein